MFNAEIVEPHEVARAVRLFHRDGFVAVKDALTPAQLDVARRGANRVIARQMAETALESANRGFARYSFGQQIQHPEWAMLVDMQTVLPIIEGIWPDKEFRCGGGGGDYSVPGAEIQKLHSDIADFLHDPAGRVSVQDLPTPFIVVNYLMVDFRVENGAIRFVPCTQRSRSTIPTLEEEPEWMRTNQLCAPAGTAVIRDVRCWHGGCANNSDEIRPMTSIGYHASWFYRKPDKVISPDAFSGMSPRAQELCAELVLN